MKMRPFILLLICLPAFFSVKANAVLNNPQAEAVIKQISYPDNVPKNYYRGALEYLFDYSLTYQKIVEQCITKKQSTMACNLDTFGIYIGEKNLIKKLDIENSIIIITPREKKELGLTEEDTIIATPKYQDNHISWHYSGGIFRTNKNTMVMKTSDIYYCPEPNTLPVDLMNGSIYVDPKNQVHYKVTVVKPKDLSDASIHFVWAAFVWEPPKNLPEAYNPISCVYTIGKPKNVASSWIGLVSIDNLAKTPTSGKWQDRSITCPDNVLDCPFQLKEGGVKSDFDHLISK